MIAAAIAQGLGLNVLQFIKHTKTDQNNSAGSKSIIYDLDVKGTRFTGGQYFYPTKPPLNESCNRNNHDLILG